MAFYGHFIYISLHLVFPILVEEEIGIRGQGYIGVLLGMQTPL